MAIPLSVILLVVLIFIFKRKGSKGGDSEVMSSFTPESGHKVQEYEDFWW